MVDDSNDLSGERGDISDDINYLVLEMHGDIKKIEQHLQEITNSIESNSNHIEKNRSDLDDIESNVGRLNTKIKVATGIATLAATAMAAVVPQLI